MGVFAMRRLPYLSVFFLLGLAWLCAPAPFARAQGADGGLFTVTDVAVDVTADSAAHARDQAFVQAQRQALALLLERLDAGSKAADGLSDDDIAALVKSFEVQSERASSVRYIGAFTVQFKPNAMRTYLGSRGVNFTEARGSPEVLLPVLDSGGHAVLWESKTRWRAAWEAAPHDDGVVPLIVPPGELDDIALIGTEDAMDGRPEALAALASRYQADGVAVAILNGSLDAPPAGGYKIAIHRYDAEGAPLTASDISLPPPANAQALDGTLGQAVKLTRQEIVRQWRQGAHQAAAPDTASSLPQAENGETTFDSASRFEPQSDMAQAAPPQRSAVARLSVTVPVATLAEWAQIRRRLTGIPSVERVDVLALTRGAASIEILFHGPFEDFRSSLAMQNFDLRQGAGVGMWILRPRG